MVVGVTATGKSTCSTILSRALSQLCLDGSTDPAHQVTKVMALNPKSISMEELYGSFNENTGDWTRDIHRSIDVSFQGNGRTGWWPFW